MPNRTSPTSVVDDCSGPFDPDWTLDRLSRAGLARLCREIMLVSMLHDRSLMPHLASLGGMDASVMQADDEWMTASPTYTRRNKKNLGIDGDGVAEVLKSLQFDVGMPHHFLDFHGEVIDHDRGSFWLPYCGAHDYVRSLSRAGDDTVVRMMCHDMEDNTFDATLKATNPRARCIPVHRPPEPDTLGGENCRWDVRIGDHDVEARPDHPNLAVLERSRAATFPFALGSPAEAGGLDDYAGDFRPGLRLEDFSHPVLVRQAKEFALDVHLLMRAAYLSVEQRHGAAVLAEIAPQHVAAIAPPLVTRLRDALAIRGDGIDAIAKLLQVNPLFPGDYVRASVEIVDETSVRVAIAECEALADDATPSPLSPLADGEDPGLGAMALAVNPYSHARRVSRHEPVWQITIDPDAEPLAPHPLAELVGAHNYADADMEARPVPVRLGPTR